MKILKKRQDYQMTLDSVAECFFFEAHFLIVTTVEKKKTEVLLKVFTEFCWYSFYYETLDLLVFPCNNRQDDLLWFVRHIGHPPFFFLPAIHMQKLFDVPNSKKQVSKMASRKFVIVYLYVARTCSP